MVRAGESLLDARARLEQEQRDEVDRLRRIERSAPPAHSYDGILQRWRDARGEDEELETVWNGGEGLTSMGERRAR